MNNVYTTTIRLNLNSKEDRKAFLLFRKKASKQVKVDPSERTDFEIEIEE